jgi:hypothetical protein
MPSDNGDMANAPAPKSSRTFEPGSDGFAFTNSWPAAPAVTVPTPFGQVGIGNAANGLCGGMVFGALDYWIAGKVPPTVRPLPGTPLYKFIVRRLVDSWHVPAGVVEYYQWMNIADGDLSASVLGRSVVVQRGVSWRTIEQQWPLVKASIDAGVPAPLGVVTVKSVNVADLGRNHQVGAYAYSVSGTEVTVRVYDPNSGRNDGIVISFDTSAPERATTFATNLNIDLPVRGFFMTAYAPADPPAA